MTNDIVIYDTEYWTDDGVLERSWKGIDDHLPVLIQIGAYRVLLENDLPVTKEWFSYISPIGRNGKIIKLNDYFSNLTGITQENVNKEGKHPKIAIAEFFDFVGHRKIYSYGNDIADTFLPTCFVNDIKCPFHIHQEKDVRHILRKSGMKISEITANRSGSIAQHLGVVMNHHHEHNAMDDARSILEALRFLVKNGNLEIAWLNE